MFKYIYIVSLFLFTISIFPIVNNQHFPLPVNGEDARVFSIFGSASFTGNTMMAATPPGNVNNILLSQNSGDINNIPYDAEIEGAFIYWTGSLNVVPDNNVYFQYADGTSSYLTADECVTTNDMGGFFYCRKDITSTLSQHPGTNNYNGTYTLGELDASVGDCINDPYLCQAKYAAWSMIVVYKSQSAISKRNIIIYEGFAHYDEHEDTIGLGTLNVQHLPAKEPVVAEFTYFGLEGDSFLGVPPQDQDPNFPCPTCYDSIKVNGSKLYDSFNPKNNIWNSSLALGVDIDSFNIGQTGLNLLTPGQQNMSIILGSGDGIIPNQYPQAGGGESVFLGYILIGVDVISPNFRTSRTSLQVDRDIASPGDSLTYILTITNDGSAIAKDLYIKNAIPPNTEYIPNSTYVDGTLSPDTIDTPNGLFIGDLNYRGDNRKTITFRVKVLDSVPSGTHIKNSAKIEYKEGDGTVSSTTTSPLTDTLITLPTLSTPLLKVRDENGGEYLPGEWVEYSVELINNTNNPVGSVKYYNSLPADFSELQIVGYPYGAVDQSDLSGKIIQIANIEIPARSVSTIRYRARVKTVSEYINSGVSEDQIDNRTISSQGYITTPSMEPEHILTDNDVGGSQHDLTTFILKNRVNADFSDSTMSVSNYNGSTIYHPDDTVQYSINVKNSANSRVTAITTSLNIDENYFENISVSNGVYDGDKIVWYISGLNSQESTTLNFSAKIRKPLQNGLIIENQAVISVDGYQTVSDDPTTSELDDKTKFTITSRSNFITSTKTYIDQNGGEYVQPGDIITYIVTLINTGDGSGTNMVVEDQIPENLSFVESLDGAVYNESEHKVVWSYQNNSSLTIVNIPIELKVKLRVNNNLPDGTEISNQATIISSDYPRVYYSDDPTTTLVNDPTKFIVFSKGELSESYKTFVDKNGGDIEPGDRIRYTIKVRNTGTLAVTNISVMDQIDQNLENITVEDGGILNGDIIEWNGTSLNTIEPNGVVDLHFEADIVDPLNHGTIISNQATINSDQFLNILTDNPGTDIIDDPTSFTVVSIPKMEITKTVEDLNGGEYQNGDEIKYTITIKNIEGGSTGNLVISDIVSNNLFDIVPANGGFLTENKIEWFLPPLNSGDEKILTFNCKIKSDIIDQTSVCNQATVFDENLNYTWISDDIGTTDQNDQTCFTAHSDSSISQFYKTYSDINGGDILPSDWIEYQLSFTNSGSTVINNIEIEDIISNKFSEISLIEGGSYQNGVVSFSYQTIEKLQSVQPGEVVSIKFRAKLDSFIENGTAISNQAKLNYGENFINSDDPETTILNDPTVFTIVSSTDIKFTKTVELENNDGEYNKGDTVLYRLKIENIGSNRVDNLVITDPINSNLVITDRGGAQFSNGVLTWSSNSISELENLYPNDQIEIVFKAKIGDLVSNGTTISNQAEAVLSNGDRVVSDNPSTSTLNDATNFVVTVNQYSVMFLKTVINLNGSNIFKPGDRIQYKLSLTNIGESNLTIYQYIYDVIDVNLENVVVENGSINGNTIFFDEDLENIPQGENREFIFTAKIKDNVEVGTEIKNQAFLSSFDDLYPPFPSDDPTTDQQLDSTNFIVQNSIVGDVDGYKTVIGGRDYKPGDIVSYKITIENNKNVAIDNLMVMDQLPEELEIFEILNNGTINSSNLITWINGENGIPIRIEPNQSLSFQFKAKVKQNIEDGTIVSNQAQYNYNFMDSIYPTDDPTTEEEFDSTNINIKIPKFSLVTKIAQDESGDSIYSLGERVFYTIKLKNSSDVIANDIKIKDNFPFQYLEFENSYGAIVDQDDGTIFFDSNSYSQLAQIGVGEEIEITYTGIIKEGISDQTLVSNQAFISFDNLNQNIPTDNPDSDIVDDPTTFRVSAKPDFTSFYKKIINKKTHYLPGEIVEYELSIENKGTDKGKNIVIVDEIDQRYFEIIDPGEGVIENGKIVFSYQNIELLNSLNPGEKISYNIKLKIDENVDNGLNISNQAYIIGDNFQLELSDDPDTEDINDTTDLIVVNGSLLYMSKTAIDIDNSNFSPSSKIRYIFKIENRGNILAQNVMFYDYIPENTTYVNNSTKVNGVLVDEDLNPPFINGLMIGDIGVGEEIDVQFDIFINENTELGRAITNQANADENGANNIVSDDPNSSEADDPTIIYVGESSNFSQFYKSSTYNDENEDGKLNIGEVLTYNLKVENLGGNSKNVEIIDTLPNNGEYISNSIIIDGVQQTDQLGDDFSSFNGESIIIKLPSFEKNEIVNISFKVRVNSGEAIENQAKLLTGDVIEFSDSDLSIPGDQKTINFIGDSEIIDIQADKKVLDINGGKILPGDILRYNITIENRGNIDLNQVEIRDNIPIGTTFITNSEQYPNEAHFIYEPNFSNNGRVRVYGLNLNKGEKIEFIFDVKVNSSVVEGEQIINKGEIIFTQLDTLYTNSVISIVGAISNSVQLSGNGSFLNKDKEKENLDSIKLKLYKLNGDILLEKGSTDLDQNGNYNFYNLKSGEYILKVFKNNLEIKSYNVGYLSNEIFNKFDFIIKPTGVIYNSDTNNPIKGVKLFLYYDNSSLPLNYPCEQLRLVENLPTGQQGQITGKDGLYYFDFPKDQYVRICVDGGEKYSFPSTIIDPELGEGIIDQNGEVNEDSYYLIFDTSKTESVLYNNIPIDSIDSKIKISKSVNKKEVSIGDILTYKISVSNNSDKDFLLDDGRGVYIKDILPSNLKYIKKSHKVSTIFNGEKNKIENYIVDKKGDRYLFGPFNFRSGDKIELTYRVVVGTNSELKKYYNKAQLVNSDISILSKESSVSVSIIPDSDFELGDVIGKIYCDSNDNKIQDIGEYGLEGVEIYSDTGYKAISDRYGKYHFSAIKPGYHMFKLDKRTLIPGIKVDEVIKKLYITNGLLVKINYPLNCSKLKFNNLFKRKDIKPQTKKEYKNLFVLRGDIKKGISIGKKRYEIKKYKLNRSSKLYFENDQIELNVPNIKKGIVNYYIKSLEENKRSYFYQKKGKENILKINLTPGYYSAYAEIIYDNEIHKTPKTPILVQYSQDKERDKEIILRNCIKNGKISKKLVEKLNFLDKFNLDKIVEVDIVSKNLSNSYSLDATIISKFLNKKYNFNKKLLRVNNIDFNGKGYCKIVFRFNSILEFKEQIFTYKNELYLNGTPIKTGKKGKVLFIRNLKDYEKYNIVLKDEEGYSSTYKSYKLSDKLSKNNPLDGLLLKNKENIDLEYDNFGKKDIVKKLIPVKFKTYSSYLEQIDIMLPPEGSKIYSNYLYIRGWQPKEVEIKIDGNYTKPDNEGYFSSPIEIKSETKYIKIEAKDKDGNIATIKRKIIPSDISYFFLALAESSIGYEATRVENDNYINFGDNNYYLHGKGVVYFKGKIRGKHLKKYLKGFFKEINGTLHFDSSKQNQFENYYTNLIDSEKFYPVYGDSSILKQDVKSKGKLYIRIDADRSKILWGNFNSSLYHSDLINYDKTLYGLDIKFQKKTGKIDNNINLFYSQDQFVSKTIYNEFRGTGGSLYYLQGTLVKDGSENVKIVVRDRDTGLIIYSKNLIINQDYNINYGTGTLLLKDPLPRFVNSSFITSGKLSNQIMEGDPLYLQVLYQTDSVIQISGNYSFGTSFKEIFFDKFYLTGNFIKEGREFGSLEKDGNYSIFGIGAGYKHTPKTELFLEYAYSESFDNMSYLSEDGGITFQSWKSEAGGVSGSAFKFNGKLSFSDFIKDGFFKSLDISGSYQYVDEQFYSIGNRLDQGGHKGTIETKLSLDKTQTVALNYSGIYMNQRYGADQFGFGVSQEFSSEDNSLKVNKQLFTTQYENRLSDKLRVIGSHQFGYISQLEKSFFTNVTSGRVYYKILSNLTLMFQQDIIEGEDQRELYFTTGDRFQTTVGVEYGLTSNFSIIGTESVRYSGDNSTLIGGKLKIDNSSSIYMNQKWDFKDQNQLSSTIVGGETGFGKDRSYKVYGEYQLDSGTTSDYSKALLGIGKTFKITKNFSVMGGYEHSFYDNSYGSDRLSDSLSVGIVYNLPKLFLISSKNEIRYDQFDKNRFHYLTANGLQYQWAKDLTFLAKFNYFLTNNLTDDRVEAEMMESSIGGAFRPYSYDFLNILIKYSLIKQHRPLSLLDQEEYKEWGHVFNVAAVFEAAFRVQFMEKLVGKYAIVSETGTKDSEIFTLLWINRVAYHLANRFDIALEYRLRRIFDYDMKSGFLIEGSYQFKKHLALGVGYNFTSFSDNIFYLNENSAGGFFIRVVGSW